MKAALAGYWLCLQCPDHGTTTATESSADVKHKDATGHSVMLGTDPESLARMREIVNLAQNKGLRPAAEAPTWDNGGSSESGPAGATTPVVPGQPGDTQPPNAHHICPNCGKPAKSTIDRLTGVGTVNTDALCPLGHVWSVHWLGGAA